MKLCFGVFAKVLYLCQKKMSQGLLAVALARCVDENSNYLAADSRFEKKNILDVEIDKSAVSKLINCKKPFSFSNGKASVPPELNVVIEKLNSLIIPFLEENEKRKIVLTLINIILTDESIESEEKELFQSIFFADKQQLRQQTEFPFLDFIGKILLYTVNRAVDNTEGQVWVGLITEAFISESLRTYLYEFEWDIGCQTLKLFKYKIFDLFNEILAKYDVRIFLEKCDPVGCIELSMWGEKCDEFNKEVENQIWCQYNERSLMIQKIQNFSQSLVEYLEYLGKNMRPLFENPDFFVPIYREENIKWEMSFGNEVSKFRSQLASCYQEIDQCSMPYQPK